MHVDTLLAHHPIVCTEPQTNRGEEEEEERGERREEEEEGGLGGMLVWLMLLQVLV